MRALEPLGISYSEHPGKRHLGPEQWQSGMKRKADTDLEDSTVKSWQAGSEDPRYHEEGPREAEPHQDSRIVEVDDAVETTSMVWNQSTRSPTETKTQTQRVKQRPVRSGWSPRTERRAE